MEKYQNRQAVPVKYRWDLSSFCVSDEAWKKEQERIAEELPKLTKFKGKLNDANELERFLKLDLDLSLKLDDLYAYAYLNHDVELENQLYIEMKNKASSLLSRYQIISAYAVPEIIALSNETFQKLFQENPNLENYRRYLEKIYEAKTHTLSEQEEKLVATLTETYDSYSNISSSLLNAEHDYGTVTLGDGEVVDIATTNYRLLRKNNDPKIRKQVTDQFQKTIAQYQNTESALLNNYVKNNINLAKIRNYSSPWDAKLKKRHLVPEIFEMLERTAIKTNDISRKYYQVAKEALHFDVLHTYDLALDWVASEKEYTIEEAQTMILASLKVLGTDYLAKAKKVFDNHYIDYCQYKGKTSGGYSYATATTDSRILLSYNYKMGDIFTIIHELGHNVHHQWINENNPLWYRSCPSIIAEIASLTNEIILSNYLFQNGKTKEERLMGLENFIRTFQNNFYGAVMEGQLEQKMYDHVIKGNSITAAYLNQEADQLLSHYRGNTVEDDGMAHLMWVTRSHYYMNFYLYDYAICISIATVVANKLIHEEKGFLEKYQDFLKCGSNLYPDEIFTKLGIDLTRQEVYENAVDYFNQQLELFRKLSKEGE